MITFTLKAIGDIEFPSSVELVRFEMPDLPQQTVDILKLGLIGLGFLLAVIAAWLINAEQKRDKVRPELLKAIYVFMVFSLVLAGGALASEVYRLKNQADLSKIPAFSEDTTQKVTELTEKTKELEKLLAERDQQISNLKGNQTEATSASEENAVLSAQIKQMEAEKIDLANELSATRKKLQDATTEIQQMKGQIEASSQSTDADAKLVEEKKRIDTENKKLKEENKALKAQMAAIEAKARPSADDCGKPDPDNEGKFQVTRTDVWRGLGGQLRLRIIAADDRSVSFDSNVEGFKAAKLSEGNQINVPFAGCNYAVVIFDVYYDRVWINVFRM